METDPTVAGLPTPPTELKRRQQTVDMMLSMHSALRDRYASWSTVLDLTILGASILLTATLLIDPSILVYLGVSSDGARLVLAIASVVVFFLSIVVLRVDWKERSAQHRQAAALLAKLKRKGREAIDGSSAGTKEEYVRLYDFTMAACVPVPERDFTRLKALHRRKVAVSKALDSYPNVPVWLLRLRLLWSDSRSVWTQTAAERGEDAA